MIHILLDANEALISQFLALVSVLDLGVAQFETCVLEKVGNCLLKVENQQQRKNILTNRILLVKNNLSFVLISYHS